MNRSKVQSIVNIVLILGLAGVEILMILVRIDEALPRFLFILAAVVSSIYLILRIAPPATSLLVDLICKWLDIYE